MWSKLGAEEEGVENIPLRNRNCGMSVLSNCSYLNTLKININPSFMENLASLY